jgi:hypothetical protein
VARQSGLERAGRLWRPDQRLGEQFAIGGAEVENLVFMDYLGRMPLQGGDDKIRDASAFQRGNPAYQAFEGGRERVPPTARWRACGILWQWNWEWRNDSGNLPENQPDFRTGSLQPWLDPITDEQAKKRAAR